MGCEGLPFHEERHYLSLEPKQRDKSEVSRINASASLCQTESLFFSRSILDGVKAHEIFYKAREVPGDGLDPYMLPNRFIALFSEQKSNSVLASDTL